MRTREMSYSDYGITDEQARAALKECRQSGSFHALIKAAEQANESISIALAFSLAYDISYDKISAWAFIPYDKSDFYAYRRKTLAIFCGFVDQPKHIKSKKQNFDQISFY